jgi:hypothetical protein
MNKVGAVFLMLLAVRGGAQTPRVEAGVQIGAVDERAALREKPAIAGGRVTVHVTGFVDAEAEIDRFPIGGGAAQHPGTEILAGARAGYRAGPIGTFATLRPGFVGFDSNLNAPALGNRPALNFGGALGYDSTRHIFARIDFGDLIVWYPPGGARHQFQGTFGMGVWF